MLYVVFSHASSTAVGMTMSVYQFDSDQYMHGSYVCTDLYVLQRMNCADLHDPLTLSPAAPLG